MVDPTNAESSEVQQTGADPSEVEGPRGMQRPVWLLAGLLFALAGIIWVVNGSDPPVVGVLFVAVGLACIALAAGFSRRR